MAKPKRLALRLTQGELEGLQRILEQAAANATPEQMAELEAIDGKVYALLFPDLVQHARAKHQTRLHPMSLRRLGVLRAVRS